MPGKYGFAAAADHTTKKARSIAAELVDTTPTTVTLPTVVWAQVKSWLAGRKAQLGKNGRRGIGAVGAVLFELLVSDDENTRELREQLQEEVTRRLRDDATT